MKWRIRLVELNYEVLYHSGPVHYVPIALSRLVHLLNTQKREPKDEEISLFVSSLVALQQRLKKQEVLGTSYSDNFLKKINVLTRSHPSS